MPYLLILPVAYVAALVVMQSMGTPYWLWTNIDPSYFYLMNGLEVAMGQAPADFHHPGTTTQLIAGLVLRLVHPALSADQLTDVVLSNPEQHLLLLAHVNDGLIAAAMLWAGIEARKLFGGLTLPTLLVQGGPFLSTVMLVNGYTVKPEATLILAASVLSALVCRQLAQPRDCQVAGLGGVLGFAVVTKVHALSLGAVPLFLVRGRSWSILVLAGAVSLLLFAMPILGHWQDMQQWFLGMATHNGAYGGGEAGLVPDNYLWNAFKQLRRPIFAVPMVFGLVVLWRRRGDLTAAEGPMARALGGVLLAQVLHLLLVAKHPISYYLIPAFLLIGLAAALTITLARPLVPVTDRIWRRLGVGLGCLLVVTQSLTIQQMVASRHREAQTSLAMDMTAFAACTKVNFDFASDRNFALMLGNWMADWRFGPWLTTHVPADTLMWVPSNGLPQQFNPVPITWDDVFSRKACTVLRGGWGPQALAELHKQVPQQKLNACTNGDEWVITAGIECESAFPGRQSKVQP